MAEILGVNLYAVQARVKLLLLKTGMGDRMEFALQQNAAVRERLRADVVEVSSNGKEGAENSQSNRSRTAYTEHTAPGRGSGAGRAADGSSRAVKI